MAEPHPWRDLDETWYAALVGPGRSVYGLARCLVRDGILRFEALDRATGAWVHASEGAGYFTGIGGITDAEPIDAATAAEIERALRAPAE